MIFYHYTENEVRFGFNLGERMIVIPRMNFKDPLAIRTQYFNDRRRGNPFNVTVGLWQATRQASLTGGSTGGTTMKKVERKHGEVVWRLTRL